ncbi:MAG TPA: ABC transporter substrate-binding protein, partial [Stellaceae bacterium]|nr:ABC transporter substrate-binding protein [Stellaceae bacterium]
MSRRVFAAVLLAFGLAIPPQGAAAAEKIVLQLARPAQFEFAGYYAALWRGYYRAAGLDVTIKPGAPSGQTPIDPVREVTEGRARFGTGSARLLVRDAEGLPLLLLAPIFQASGARVYYRAGADFSSPGALLQARIGRLPASNSLDIELRTALQAEGIDIDKLHSVPIAPGGAVAA